MVFVLGFWRLRVSHLGGHPPLAFGIARPYVFDERGVPLPAFAELGVGSRGRYDA